MKIYRRSLAFIGGYFVVSLACAHAQVTAAISGTVQDASGGRNAGSFGHGGAYKTAMSIDPTRKLVLVLMRQHDGEFLVPEGNKIEAVFLKTATDQFSTK